MKCLKTNQENVYITLYRRLKPIKIFSSTYAYYLKHCYLVFAAPLYVKYTVNVKSRTRKIFLCAFVIEALYYNDKKKLISWFSLVLRRECLWFVTSLLMLLATHVGVQPKQEPWGIGEQDVRWINSESSEWAIVG